MRSNRLYYYFGLLAAMALACNLSAPTQPGPTPSVQVAPTGTAKPRRGTATATLLAEQTPTFAVPSTSAVQPDAILVDTFSQEVYPFEENGNCSLGEALWAALTHKQVDGCAIPPGSTTIYLPTGTYPLMDEDNSPILLPGNTSADRLGLAPAGFPVIFDKVTILGNGSTIQRTGPNKFGVFQLFVRGDLTLDDLTITGGDTTGSQYSQADGGALQLSGGQALLRHVTLTSNQAENGGAMVILGAVVTIEDSVIQGNISTGEGGGIYNSGTLTLKRSQVSANTAHSDVFGGGGIFNDAGQLTLDLSRIEGNTAMEGGGIYNDGGSVTLQNGSILAANQALESGADIPHGGGAINNIGENAQVTVIDSFILENHAEQTTGGGIYNQALLTITDSVLAYNVSGGGGALFNDIEGTGSISHSCIIQNQVVGATASGLGGGIESASEQPFDARRNWWDAADGPGPFGPGSGDSVTHNVAFDDYLKVAPEICSAENPIPAVTPVAP